MGRFLMITLVGVLAATVASAAPTRVDNNGELASNWTQPGPPWDTSGATPFNWQWYAEGLGGGLGRTYNTGSSANAYNLRGEHEPLSTTGAGTDPNGYGGHGIIFGGAGGVGRHGIMQTINSTAGRHYWLVGTAKGASATNAYHQWGIGNGAGVPTTVGRESNGSLFGGSGTLGKQTFNYGMVATGSQVTTYVGLRNAGSHGVNIYADGFRVLESPVNAYTGLYNGGFEGASYNVTNWSNGIPADSGSVTDQYMFDGWLPLGGTSGQVCKIQPQLGENDEGLSLMVDTYKGGGRQYFFQRVNDGLPAHAWDFTARVKTVNYNNADNRLGIDPTGGTDPSSPNVIWGDTNTAYGLWQTLSVSATGSGTNGITLFLASGWDFSRGNRCASGTAYGADQSTQSWFDGLVLIPEPAAILLLGLPMLLIRRRRA